MELKDYIKEAVISIKEAASDVDAHMKNTGQMPSSDEFYTPETSVKSISFDIATTVSETSGSAESGGAGAGIKIAGISIGGRVEGEQTANATSEHVSRIKFDLKINY
jgi:hypothetical protein